jgi:ribosome modulation factor
MKLNRFAIPALALTLGVSGLILPQASAQQGPPPPGYGNGQGYGHDQGGWDTPPQEFRDIQRQGFHDGIEGARKDFGNHRQPNVNNREEYRNPRVPRELRHDYRDGFRRGYDAGVAHLMGEMGPR